MKKSIKTLLAVFFLLLFASFVFSKLSKPKTINHSTHIYYDNKLNGKDSVPLLVLTTYFNNRTSITAQEIRNKIISGEIKCTKDVTDRLKKTFKLSRDPESIFINNCSKTSDSLIFITGIDSVNVNYLSMEVDSIDFFKTPNKYPLWVKNENNSTFNFSKQITSYVHTGVTALTRSTGSLLDRISLDKYIYNILPYFKNPDLVHISNEVSFSDSVDYSTMKMSFASKLRDFEILKKLNVSLVELTGNHNLDFGSKAYLNTLKWYRDNKIDYFGGGKNKHEASSPLIRILEDGTKIAWIGFNELCPCGECTDRTKLGIGANRFNKDSASKIINRLKYIEHVDYIIACVQFGERDSYQPSESQKKICRELIDFGSDVIIGSQAHQAQEIAIYKGKLIFYGTGNFMFDQIHRIGVRQAFFLECYFYKGKIIQFKPVYTFMQLNRIPNVATYDEASAIKKAILRKSNFQ